MKLGLRPLLSDARISWVTKRCPEWEFDPRYPKPRVLHKPSDERGKRLARDSLPGRDMAETQRAREQDRENRSHHGLSAQRSASPAARAGHSVAVGCAPAAHAVGCTPWFGCRWLFAQMPQDPWGEKRHGNERQVADHVRGSHGQQQTLKPASTRGQLQKPILDRDA